MIFDQLFGALQSGSQIMQEARWQMNMQKNSISGNRDAQEVAFYPLSDAPGRRGFVIEGEVIKD